MQLSTICRGRKCNNLRRNVEHGIEYAYPMKYASGVQERYPFPAVVARETSKRKPVPIETHEPVTPSREPSCACWGTTQGRLATNKILGEQPVAAHEHTAAVEIDFIGPQIRASGTAYEARGRRQVCSALKLTASCPAGFLARGTTV